jgi:hypothetical protein
MKYHYYNVQHISLIETNIRELSYVDHITFFPSMINML